MTANNLLLLCNEGAVAKPLAAKLSKAGFNIQNILPTVAYRGQAADAVVLISDLQQPEDCQLVRRIYISKPGCAMVLCTDKADTDLIKKAVGYGITAVAELDDDASVLATVITEAVGREQARVHAGGDAAGYEGRVLSVFGTKGGTGKTTIAVNLALALASKKRTALLDLDLQFGDVAIFMDISKADNIASLVEAGSFTQNAVLSYMQPHPSGLMVLCAPSSPEYAELISADSIQKILTALKQCFDYIILDMPPVFNEISLAGLEQSERIYFVTNPDISNLRNAKVSLEVLDSIRMSQKVDLLINKQGFSSIKQKTVEDILEKHPVLVVPHDHTRAINAVNQGVPLVTGQPRCKVSQAIIKYAAVLSGSEHAHKRLKLH